MPRGTDRYDEARLQGRLWTPALLGADLLGWWDVGDLRDIASASSAVTTWRDRSGRGNSLTGGGSTVTLGDKKITAASSGRFTAPASFWNVHDGAFVARPTSTAAHRTLFSYQGSRFDQIYIPSGGHNWSSYVNGVTTQFGALTWTASEIGIGYFQLTAGGNTAAARNGTAALSAAGAGTTPTTNTSFLSDNPAGTSGQPWGEMHEYVYMSASRPLYIREAVTGYLAWKWDRLLGFDLVSKLPASHTHKTKPPLIGT